ncbi:unnamed protein product [Orchesella dallaii]|uniref:Uncharacterized protein n=1 Tax=Orchesella dallaii TaxID=48710 RepID=A0ABP1QCS1_9HEXA
MDQVNDHVNTPLSLVQVSELLGRIDKNMEALESVHYKIVALCIVDADIVVQDTTFEPMQEAYMTTRVKLLEIQASLQQANPSSSVARSSSAASKIKLPRIELPKFTGRYEDWISF